MEVKERSSKIEQFIVRFYKYVIFILVLLLVGAFISDVFKERYYIEDMEASIFEEKLSITEKELHKRLKDEMDAIYQFAHSNKGLNPKVSNVTNPFSVDVGGISTNYFTLVDFVKFKLDIPYDCIAGVIYADDDRYYYRTRIGETLVDHQTMTFDSTHDYVDIFHSVIHAQALGIVKHNDPYIAAMYHYRNNDFEECIKIAEKSLKIQPEARMYALGTIANSYRDLGDFKQSEKYYLQSIQEFPNWYPSYWQYGLMLVQVGRYDEAEEHFTKTLQNDPKMKKAAIRSLLQLYCTQNQSSVFHERKQEYLEIGKIQELQRDTVIAKCL